MYQINLNLIFNTFYVSVKNKMFPIHFCERYIIMMMLLVIYPLTFGRGTYHYQCHGSTIINVMVQDLFTEWRYKMYCNHR